MICCCVHYAQILDEIGRELPGSPCAFVAFDDGLARFLEGRAEIENQYARVVPDRGNAPALLGTARLGSGNVMGVFPPDCLTLSSIRARSCSTLHFGEATPTIGTCNAPLFTSA